VPPMALKCRDELRKFVRVDECFEVVDGSLLGALRRLVADDPDHLPRLGLKVLRAWSCTNLWEKGVSSSWLMMHMHHTRWSVTKGYLATKGLPKWRDRPLIEVGCEWVPRSAFRAGVVSEPSMLGRVIAKRRRDD